MLQFEKPDIKLHNFSALKEFAAVAAIKTVRDIRDFAAWAKSARTEYRQAKAKQGDRRPSEKPAGVLRQRCYSYYSKLQQASLVDELATFVSERDGGRWRRGGGDGAVWVLRLLETDKNDPIDSGERSRVALELNTAFRFGVRPGWILLFLYDAGPFSCIKKLSRARQAPKWALKYTKIYTGKSGDVGAMANVKSS